MKPQKTSLETSDGLFLDNPAEDDLSTAIEKIGNGIDHCILSLGENDFIQAAGSKNRLLLQYRDKSGMYESSRSDFSAAEAFGIFLENLNGGDAWKTKHLFTLIDSGGVDGDDAGAAASSAGGPAGPRSLKEELFDSVKKETESGLGRLIGKIIRGLFNK